jgi:hypothetical protein
MHGQIFMKNKIFRAIVLIQAIEILLDIYGVINDGEARISVLANFPICILIASVWYANIEKQLSAGKLLILVGILWKCFSLYLAKVGYYDKIVESSIGFLIAPIYLLDIVLWVTLFVTLIKKKLDPKS